MPPASAFPFAVRVTSDLLAVDGGSAPAALNSGCLALMDAGVPLEAAPVAGVAAALVHRPDAVPSSSPTPWTWLVDPDVTWQAQHSPHRTSLIVSFGRTSPRRGRRTRPTPSCGSLALPTVPPSFKWWCRPTSTCRQGWPPVRFEAPLAFPAPPPGLTTRTGRPRTAVLDEAPAWLAQAAAAMHACLPVSRPSLKDSAPRACNVRGRTHSHAYEPT